MFGFSYAGFVYFGQGRQTDNYTPRTNPDIDGIYLPSSSGSLISLEATTQPESKLLIRSATNGGKLITSNMYTALFFDDSFSWISEDDEHFMVEEYKDSSADRRLLYKEVRTKNGILR